MDYKRMEWQVRANKIAVGAMNVFGVLWFGEFVYGARQHSMPWWAIVPTIIAFFSAYFIKEHTDMYRIDR